MQNNYIIMYLAFWFTILGAVIGSFLDCAAWRYVRGESILHGRSHCGSCGHVLGLRDLIPVYSYLAYRGKCRYCGAQIPREAVVAELCGKLAFGGLALKLAPPLSLASALNLAKWLIFASLLLLISLIDASKRIIPDVFLVAVIGNRLLFLVLEGNPIAHLPELLLGACSVSVPLLILVLIMDQVLGRESMGGGDIKLLFVTGLYLNWQQMFLTLLAACILGLIAAAVLQLRRKDQDPETEKESATLPFGPCIAAAAVLVFLCGDPVIHWYTSFF